ncbi:hypothetical protein FD25_GL002308 [Levilactobacillus acidifarinae DSM 19394]|uniref:Secreted protein n=2 Tax=Levilactobacillus acidifarinae TaxID=267364 RepID=A0A0R1LIS4_9LACO|nr:hypothetical protein FD25_GL002308 [Levilactobacillus acidifarinae DSM 19394]
MKQVGVLTVALVGLSVLTTPATASARGPKSALAANEAAYTAAVVASVAETEPTAVRGHYQHVVRVQTQRAHHLEP